MTTTDAKFRTITLTGRRPVRIQEDQWPLLASGTWRDHDGQIEAQANRTWLLRLTVRQHADGRAIVYGVYEYDTNFQGASGFAAREGTMCDPGADLIAAIRTVGDNLRERLEDADDDDHMSEGRRHLVSVIAECIGDLPPETLK